MISFACNDIEFKDLLRCSFDMNKTEYNVFMLLLKSDKYFTVEKIAEKLDLTRTTIQKAVKRLADKDVLIRFQENLDKGGYTYLYKIKDKEVIKEWMQNIVEKWYSEVIKEIKNW